MERTVANESKFDLTARPSHELMQMQKRLMLFLEEGGYQFVDEEGYIKVQISPLKIIEKPKAK